MAGRRKRTADVLAEQEAADKAKIAEQEAAVRAKLEADEEMRAKKAWDGGGKRGGLWGKVGKLASGGWRGARAEGARSHWRKVGKAWELAPQLWGEWGEGISADIQPIRCQGVYHGDTLRTCHGTRHATGACIVPHVSPVLVR